LPYEAVGTILARIGEENCKAKRTRPTILSNRTFTTSWKKAASSKPPAGKLLPVSG
jgi:hypothetical protein